MFSFLEMYGLNKLPSVPLIMRVVGVLHQLSGTVFFPFQLMICPRSFSFASPVLISNAPEDVPFFYNGGYSGMLYAQSW